MCATNTKSIISKIDAAPFKALFKIKPHLHAFAMIYNWLIIAGAISFFLLVSNIWLYPFVLLVIGARMHALTVLMHDATHFRFLKNRKWNDLISNLFIMYPIFTSIEKYRANHLKHHQHLNTENDPDWVAKLTKREFQFPKSKTEFLLTLTSYFILYQGILDAIWFVKRYQKADSNSNPNTHQKTERVVFYVVMMGMLTIFNLWSYYLLFWIIPYLTSFFMFQYIRSVAEHFGDLAYEDDLSSSRTVRASVFEKFFFAPHSVGYHLEHHLFPGVPFYNLSKLHYMLMEQDEYRDKAHVTNGYVMGLLGELEHQIQADVA